MLFLCSENIRKIKFHTLLKGIASTLSQSFSPKLSDDMSNFLFCGSGDQCSMKHGFGQDLAARNIQRGRDHGLPGIN